MPPVAATAVATGLAGAIGCDYDQPAHRLLFVEYGGTISSVALAGPPVYSVVGGGYSELEDIALSRDGAHAYVTERGGNLLLVDLANGARSMATLVSSGLSAPHQIALDETHGHAYVVEFASPGRLVRIDLGTGAQTVIVAADSAIGLLLSDDLRFAYVTEQLGGGNGRLSRIDLSTGLATTLFTSPTAPLFMMTWMDATKSAIYVTERDPANTVWVIDELTSSPPAARAIASVAPRPSSVAVGTPGRLLVCCDAEIDELDLTGYGPMGPLLLGVGFVPIDRISSSGYASTDAGYFFHVTGAPFGGTLPINFNHPRAWTVFGARYYQIIVDGTPRPGTWSDYKWNPSPSPGHSELVPTSSDPSGLFPVRDPADLWPVNPFLGDLLDTSSIPDGPHTVSLALFDAGLVPISMGGEPFTSATLQIDNGAPIAMIEQILHDGTEVPVCETVTTGSYDFTFQITASKSNGHLRAWTLTAEWGDNRYKTVASESYPVPPIPPPIPDPPPPWTGVSSGIVPPTPWDCRADLPSPPAAPGTPDPTSWHCAHTFQLDVWDRVTNGWSHQHYAVWRRSITINLP